jgi:hypothetical protein
MNGIGWTTQKFASAVKVIQTGKVQFYAWVFVIATFIITIWALFL